MKVTIDLDRDIIIIPDNFFKKISEDNERLQKYGAQPQKGLDRINRSFAVAMADTDTRLLTRSNAKYSSDRDTLRVECKSAVFHADFLLLRLSRFGNSTGSDASS